MILLILYLRDRLQNFYLYSSQGSIKFFQNIFLLFYQFFQIYLHKVVLDYGRAQKTKALNLLKQRALHIK